MVLITMYFFWYIMKFTLSNSGNSLIFISKHFPSLYDCYVMFMRYVTYPKLITAAFQCSSHLCAIVYQWCLYCYFAMLFPAVFNCCELSLAVSYYLVKITLLHFSDIPMVHWSLMPMFFYLGVFQCVS